MSERTRQLTIQDIPASLRSLPWRPTSELDLKQFESGSQLLLAFPEHVGYSRYDFVVVEIDCDEHYFRILVNNETTYDIEFDAADLFILICGAIYPAQTFDGGDS